MKVFLDSLLVVTNCNLAAPAKKIETFYIPTWSLQADILVEVGQYVLMNSESLGHEALKILDSPSSILLEMGEPMFKGFERRVRHTCQSICQKEGSILVRYRLRSQQQAAFTGALLVGLSPGSSHEIYASGVAHPRYWEPSLASCAHMEYDSLLYVSSIRSLENAASV